MSEETKWTSGPWDTDTGGDVTDINGVTLLRREDSFADAELAAAAPELYEALEYLVDLLDGNPGLGPARAALAKARGEG